MRHGLMALQLWLGRGVDIQTEGNMVRTLGEEAIEWFPADEIARTDKQVKNLNAKIRTLTERLDKV